MITIWLKKNWGTVFIPLGITYLLAQFVLYCFFEDFPWWLKCIELTYVGLFAVSFGIAHFLWFNYRHAKSNERRIVEPSELAMLYSEVNMYGGDREESKYSQIAKNEVEKLVNREAALNNTSIKIDESKDLIFELTALPLRRALVDLYPLSDLQSKAKEELNLLNEYTPDDGSYDDTYEGWETRITKANKEIIDLQEERLIIEGDIILSTQTNLEEKLNLINKKLNITEANLRADLKSLREAVAWFDQTWAKGEIYINVINYWAVVSVMILVFVGVLPIIHPDGNKLLNLLHWASLGLSGALLSSIVANLNQDVNEVGERDGKQLVSLTITRMAIGSMTAILLYVALMGGVLAGSLFPKELPLTTNMIIEEPRSFWLYTGLSIFWAVIAGFSLNILKGLVNIAESTFNNKKD